MNTNDRTGRGDGADMPPNDDIRDRLLAARYGLLDAAEAAELAAAVAASPELAAAAAEADAEAVLLARAAKLPFPAVKFAAPAVVPAAAKPARFRAAPWVLAAGICLAVGVVLSTAKSDRDAHRDEMRRHETAAAVSAEYARGVEAARQKAAAAESNYARAADNADRVLTAWVKADAAAVAARPFVLDVAGPAAAVPGAPNDYTLVTRTPAGEPFDAELSAVLKDAAGGNGRELAVTRGKPGVSRVRIPADAVATTDSELSLVVTATDRRTGAAATVTETLRLQEPVFATFLTTDKPLYRPGEPVFFRSLTLDRTRFLPPARDLTLRFDLLKPDGKRVETATITGRAEPAGPDGTPVKGIGCGVLALPADLPGGRYTLTVTEVPPGHADAAPPVGSVPLATRAFLVRTYTPETFLKTLTFDAAAYSAGDRVTAKLTVLNQAKPAGKVQILTTAKIDGRQAAEWTAPAFTAADGTATIRFTIPTGTDPADATLSVTVLGPPTEVIVRPVPLAPKSPTVEFFPEGGTLVAGLPNRVYVRATNAAGRPVDLAGTITDGTRVVASVETVADADHPEANRGTAAFRFTPEAGRRYTLKLHRPSNVVPPGHPALAAAVGFAAAPAAGYPLPVAAGDGVTLSVPDGVFTPQQPLSVNLASPTPRKLLVGAYLRGSPLGFARAVLEPGVPKTVTIPPSKLPAGGVVRVTVFEEPDPAAGRAELKPVAERLVFRRPAAVLNLSVNPDRGDYRPADRVNLNVAATDETGKPTAAVLWAAVVNQSVVTTADDRTERTLPTHFLIAGEVQKPDALEDADFLLTDHPRAAESLDLLLGTQGWRRFAEQAPERFRTTVPAADAARFLISAGVRPGTAASGIDPAAAAHVPEYAAAVVAVEAAAAERDTTRAVLGAVQGRNGPSVGPPPPADYTTTWISAAVAVVILLTVAAALRPSRTLSALAAAGWLVGIGAALSTGNFGCGGGFKSVEAPPPTMESGRITREDMLPPTVSLPPPDESIGRGSLESADKVKPLPKWNPVAMPPTNTGRDARNGTGPAVEERIKKRLEPGLTEGAPLPPAEADALKRVLKKIPRHPAFAAREYAHARTNPTTDPTRADFTETLLWHPLIVLPGDGKTTLSFQLGDSIAPHRVLVAGHTADGRIGSVSRILEVRKPFALDVKLPTEVTRGDTIDAPVTLTNGTPADGIAGLEATGDGLTVGIPAESVKIPARGAAATTLPLTAHAVTPGAKVRVSGRLGTLADSVERSFVVSPDGFPAAGAAGGVLDGPITLNFTMPDILVPGTLTAKLTVFANPVAELSSGLDGLLREPHGCFEQTSSANYPNVLVLDYLKNAGKGEAGDRARGMLDRGYAKLVGYEVARKQADGREGFEWFGHYPPHGPLSAYGLMQFTDMNRVHSVDPVMLRRTRDYLLSLRDGRGGFRPPDVVHGFGAASNDVASLYTLWALTEADGSCELSAELTAAAATAGDSYTTALAANALANRSDPRAAKLLTALTAMQLPDGTLPAPRATITRSGTTDAVTEATALAALAFLKGGPVFAAAGRSAAHSLASRRTAGGTFGATQATVLALKALTAHARAAAPVFAPGAGVIAISRDGKPFGMLAFRADDLAPASLVIENPDALLPAGPSELTLTRTGGGPVPFTLSWTATARKPAAEAGAKVSFAATLDRAEYAEGDMARLNVNVTNAAADERGMVVAIVGLPAGVAVPTDSKQLTALTAAGAFDYWEARGRELVFYWRGMAPSEAKAFALDLVAAFPGRYVGPAGRAYEYYSPQSRHWIDPLIVRVTPRQ